LRKTPNDPDRRLKIHSASARLSTPEKPNSPLLLGAWEWEALLKSDGHTSVTDWNCGDHGSGYEWKAILDAHGGALHAKLRSYECNPQGSAGKLIEVVVR
jgi:hypothetical protein